MRQQFGKKIFATTAGMCLMAAGLVGVAAPASAGPYYSGNAWLDCDSGVKFANISGHGYGACDMGKWQPGDPEVIIKECGTQTEFECPLVEVGPPKDDEAETDTGTDGAITTDPGPGMTWAQGPVCASQSPGPDWEPVDAGDFCDRARDGGSAWALKGAVEEGEPEQSFTPPPPCWDPSLNNCPVGGALKFDAPAYAMVGVPITLEAYASWRPDENSPAQPTNGTAVIRVDGEDYSGVEFKDGVAEWRFIPETPGVKDFTASGVVSSGLSGANAYIDTVPASVQVLPYDPDAFAQALKRKAVEAGEKFTIVDKDQARAALAKRLEWNVSDDSEDVCAVYETKKGKVKAKFNGEGKCTVTWLDPKSGDEGKYTFIAKK